MALIACAECKAQISDKAAACPRCGAPVMASHVTATSAAASEPRTFMWYWWLWGPIGLIVAFLLFGAMLPKATVEANEFARACRELAKGDPLLLRECDRGEARIRYRDEEPVVGPPANTGFVPEPPLPPSSLSNDEIVRRALYPQLSGSKGAK